MKCTRKLHEMYNRRRTQMDYNFKKKVTHLEKTFSGQILEFKGKRRKTGYHEIYKLLLKFVSNCQQKNISTFRSGLQWKGTQKFQRNCEIKIFVLTPYRDKLNNKSGNDFLTFRESHTFQKIKL